jgi:hypothetical protein
MCARIVFCAESLTACPLSDLGSKRESYAQSGWNNGRWRCLHSTTTGKNIPLNNTYVPHMHVLCTRWQILAGVLFATNDVRSCSLDTCVCVCVCVCFRSSVCVMSPPVSPAARRVGGLAGHRRGRARRPARIRVHVRTRLSNSG